MESVDLETRARRAYEIGRVRWALQVAWIVVALVLISFLAAGASPITAATGLALLGVVTLLRWRGRAWAAAVRAGLTAGLIPYALLLTLKCSSGYFCMLGGCMAHCARFCIAGGLAAGFVLALSARRHEGEMTKFLVAAGAVAALTGLLGCFVGGVTGVLWMALGELTATLPAFAVPARRR
jgi:hypothetical protein